MPKEKIRATALSERDYLHGHLQCLGNRQAMVVRTDNCNATWTFFAYENNRQWCVFFGVPDTDRSEAYAGAKRYLETGELPRHPDGKPPQLVERIDEIVARYLPYCK